MKSPQPSAHIMSDAGWQWHMPSSACLTELGGHALAPPAPLEPPAAVPPVLAPPFAVPPVAVPPVGWTLLPPVAVEPPALGPGATGPPASLPQAATKLLANRPIPTTSPTDAVVL